MARCLVQPGQIGSLFPNAAVSGEVKDWDDSCDLVLRFAKVTGGPTKSRPRIAPVLKLLECYCRFLLLVVDLHVMRFCAGCGSAGRVDGSDLTILRNCHFGGVPVRSWCRNPQHARASEADRRTA
jgi:hypothetical protein